MPYPACGVAHPIHRKVQTGRGALPYPTACGWSTQPKVRKWAWGAALTPPACGWSNTQKSQPRVDGRCLTPTCVGLVHPVKSPNLGVERCLTPPPGQGKFENGRGAVPLTQPVKCPILGVGRCLTPPWCCQSTPRKLPTWAGGGALPGLLCFGPPRQKSQPKP